LSGELGGYLAVWRFNLCKSDDDVLSLYRWLSSARDAGLADYGTLQVLSAIEEKLPSAETPDTLTLTINGDHPLRMRENSDYRRWLWARMQSGDEQVWSALMEIANLVWTEQAFHIDYTQGDIIIAAVKKYVIANMAKR
jgi:hypothetical protein